jgi:hypothetical protein
MSNVVDACYARHRKKPSRKTAWLSQTMRGLNWGRPVSPSTSPPSPLGGAPDRPGRLGLKEGPEVKDERRRREDYDEIDRSIEKTEGS